MNDNFETTTGEIIPPEEIISTLNGLIQTCKDGEDGFKLAAESVKDNSSLESTFNTLSTQRAHFAKELTDIVMSLGGTPAENGTVAAMLHRGWMDIKAAVTSGDEAAILNECERGEDSAKGAYNDALAKAMPTEIKDTVRRQTNLILDAHRQIKTLRDNANNVAAANTAKA